jgi:hypothetical protein
MNPSDVLTILFYSAIVFCSIKVFLFFFRIYRCYLHLECLTYLFMKKGHEYSEAKELAIDEYKKIVLFSKELYKK